ncbi:MAG: chemotaxis protein CheA, partial [SAR324 cluster bacterium]|nr:chemotaxis protein CheA [SAR324 cluster bacterium]
LVHLLRNSMDHGIETPDVRSQRDKSEWGYITFTISRVENNLILKIADDGQGLDLDKVIQQALSHPGLESSLIQQWIDRQVAWKILFLPGFSTATKVTDVSGRGVGLDAVKAMIEELGGSIEVETEPHQGTAFVLNIPLKN